MITHKNPMVQSTGEEIAAALADIERLFKPGVKITMVARCPGFPDGSRDMVISNDNLKKVIAAIEIRIEAGAKP